MREYFLKRDHCIKKIISFPENLNGFRMKPKLKKRKSLIDIQEINLIEETLKERIIKTQFNIVYRRLFTMLLDIAESSDTTTGDCIIALNEISKVESMIEKKYQKELNLSETNKMKKKLLLLKQEAERKKIEIRSFELVKEMAKPKVYAEEKGRGR